MSASAEEHVNTRVQVGRGAGAGAGAGAIAKGGMGDRALALLISAVLAALAHCAGLLPALVAAFVALGASGLVWRGARARAGAAPGRGRSIASLALHRAALKVLQLLGRRQRARLEADARDVRTAQAETLVGRLRRHARTRYGREHGFASVTDSQTFVRRHPVTGYEHYRQWVERVAAGEAGVLVPGKPPLLLTTSGTSGPPSVLLGTKETSSEFFLQGVAVCLDVMKKSFPAMEGLQRTTKFFYNPSFRQSKAGIPIGPNCSTPASSRMLLSLYTTPAAAFQVANERSALYLHLLFALKDLNVGMLESNFASTIFYAFSALQEWWQELVEDIELGRVNPRLDIEEGVRKSLNKLLEPDPKRAANLRSQFEVGFQGIALRLWPQLNLVLTVDSGSNQIYGELLRQQCCEGVPFYSPFYAATEGLIGVNLWPTEERRQYLLCPRSMFCEFIAEASLEDDQPCTVMMDQVQEGQCYELVVTNAAGLYRYRIGDVVKVVRFYHQCPVVEFQYRRGQTLNVRGEKISEAVFLGALKRAVSQWPGAIIVDYCCAESGILGQSSGGSDPHYQVFLEMQGVRNLTEEQRYKLDHCLQEDSVVYKSFRFKGSIGPMRVHLVARGAFLELHSNMMASSHSSPNTFKMHRVLRRKECVDFLLGKIIS